MRAAIACGWPSRGPIMADTQQKLLGVGLALGFLALGLTPVAGLYFLGIPLFFITYLTIVRPGSSRPFMGTYIGGLFAGRLLLHWFSPSLVFPEALALLTLGEAPRILRLFQEKTAGRFREQIENQRILSDKFKAVAEKLKKENIQIEKQLRQIEHLYDIIKEAGATLNVQEMIELTREFTERMFDLPHFIIAVLSNDGKKYEVRVASGCDESLFRAFEVELESDRLAALLAREKKPVWVDSIGEQDHFAKLRNLAIQSFVFLPFLVQDRTIGFLCSFSTSDKFIDQEEFSNFQVFCNQISIGLQKSLLYEKVQKLSITDGLTKLYSHRYFKQRLEEELVLAQRYAASLSLLILDIDHFKHYNDTYGHVAGDHVLMEVARILKDQSEVAHQAARYGGEEMVLVAPETTKEQAMELAEKIRKAVENYSFSVGKETTRVTVSIGVATFPQDAHSSLDLIGKADKALYAAKNRGRNRIVAYPL